MKAIHDGMTVSIDVANAPAFSDEPKPRRKHGLPPFFGSYGRDMAENVASNLAQQQAWMTDIYHGSEADTPDQWDFTAMYANTRTPDGESVAELLAEAENQVLENMYHMFGWFASAYEMEPPTKAEAADGPLGDVAHDVVWHKLVWSTYVGAKAEETVGETLLKELGGNRYLAVSSRIEAVCDRVDSAEAEGIDLYFPGTDQTVQVKTGDGGSLSDCNADYLARYHGDTGRIEVEAL